MDSGRRLGKGKAHNFIKAVLGKAFRHRITPRVPQTLLIIGLVLSLFIFYREFIIGGKIKEFERQFWFLLSSLAFLSILGAGFISYYEYHGIGPQDGIIRRGSIPNVVALTFDDGPNPKYTPKILDILREKKVKATFFVVGKHVEKYPEIARRIVEEGHELGNHTYSHRDLVPSVRRVLLREIGKTEKALIEICGQGSNIFRPPRGVYSNAVRKFLLERGYKIILWSLSTQDWRGITPQKILGRVKRYVKGGSIVLFHDSGALLRPEGGLRESTVKALPLVIDYLIEKGYRIVTVGEMLSMMDEEKEVWVESVVKEV